MLQPAGQLTTRHPQPSRPTSISPVNDNGSGRRVTVRLAPPASITTAEIEVFSLLLADMASVVAANDNSPDVL